VHLQELVAALADGEGIVSLQLDPSTRSTTFVEEVSRDLDTVVAQPLSEQLVQVALAQLGYVDKLLFVDGSLVRLEVSDETVA
jgi:hypothetical protein